MEKTERGLGYEIKNSEDKRFINRSKERLGETNKTNDGSQMEIIEYNGAKNVTIMFDNNAEHIVRDVEYRSFKEGKVKNPFKPTTGGYGFVGVGKYVSSKNGIKTKEYNTWKDMILHNPKERISKKWHCFQSFAEDFLSEENIALLEDTSIRYMFRSIDDEVVYSKDTAFIMPVKLKNILVEPKLNENGLLDGVYENKLSNGNVSYLTRVYDSNSKRINKTFNTSEEANALSRDFKKEKNRQVLSDCYQNGQLTEDAYNALVKRWC